MRPYYNSSQSTIDFKDYVRSNSDDLIEYIEYLYQLIGCDLSLDKFRNMTDAEKIQLIRDKKINNITDVNS